MCETSPTCPPGEGKKQKFAKGKLVFRGSDDMHYSLHVVNFKCLDVTVRQITPQGLPTGFCSPEQQDVVLQISRPIRDQR